MEYTKNLFKENRGGSYSILKGRENNRRSRNIIPPHRRGRSEDLNEHMPDRTTMNANPEELNTTRGSRRPSDSLNDKMEDLINELNLGDESQGSTGAARNRRRHSAHLGSNSLNASVSVADLQPGLEALVKEEQEKNALLLRENELLKQEVRDSRVQKQKSTEFVAQIQSKLEKEKKYRDLQDQLTADLREKLAHREHTLRTLKEENQSLKKQMDDRLYQVNEIDVMLEAKEIELVESLQKLQLTQKEVEIISKDHLGALEKIKEEAKSFEENANLMNTLVKSKYLYQLRNYSSLEEQAEKLASKLSCQLSLINSSVNGLLDIHNSEIFKSYFETIKKQSQTYIKNSEVNNKLWDEQFKLIETNRKLEIAIEDKDSIFKKFKYAIDRLEGSMIIFLMLLGIWSWTMFWAFIKYLGFY